MQGTLEQFLAGAVFAFILSFVRIGTAIMIMPGLGDSFISERIRLLMALGLSFVLFPVVMPFVPTEIPPTGKLLVIVASELVIGLMIDRDGGADFYDGAGYGGDGGVHTIRIGERAGV